MIAAGLDLDPFDTFYTDADGVRSQAGWYYLDAVGQPIGPYQSEHAARFDAHHAECEE
jgi:hypothetical protein